MHGTFSEARKGGCRATRHQLNRRTKVTVEPAPKVRRLACPAGGRHGAGDPASGLIARLRARQAAREPRWGRKPGTDSRRSRTVDARDRPHGQLTANNQYRSGGPRPSFKGREPDEIRAVGRLRAYLQPALLAFRPLYGGGSGNPRYVEYRLLAFEQEIAAEVLAGHLSGYSTSGLDLVRDLIP